MVELSPDVFLRGFDQAVVAFEIDIVFPHQAPGGFRLSDPFLDGRQVMDVFGMQERLHDPAIAYDRRR